MPSQYKDYANQNTKYAVLNQKNTPLWILDLNIDLRSFVARQLLMRIYSLFGVQSEVLKIALAYKNDK